MSTLRTINVIHPSGTTNNIVNDASGNVTAGANLYVTTNLGVGTSSPTAKLHVAGTGTAARIIVESTGTANSNLPSLYFSRTSTTSAAADLQGSFVWQRTLTDSTTITSSIQSFGSNVAASPAMNLIYNAYTSHQFQINSVETARIDSSGNVGIGTSSPGQKLEVAGNNYQMRLGQGGATGSYDIGRNPTDGIFKFYGNQTGAVAYTFGGVDGEFMRIDSSGNVGIGTSSPSAKLHSYVGTATQIANVIQNSVSYLNYGTFGAGESYVYTGAAYSLLLGTNNAERMRIDTSGNVGIGTSTPASYAGFVSFKYVTSGSQNYSGCFSDTINSTLYIGHQSGVSNLVSNAALALYSNSAERMRIDSNGNVIAGGSVALATTATNGFLYVPTCAGTPTGTPTAVTGMAPIVVNTTDNKLYFYSGGAWRDAGP